ncbi:Wzz/FepE/Etk N-terminal domain-containing protein [Teredinibacter turnerae]|uniref:Wzz/FepE/Etk N-terminal domain-containing protein n=1 Tax=Teredinibacter turnerae TaxID=2426 RepID=UPI0003807321|nr:Wzz/FepE/Etk N-terminal domain-containing protein [Teredinibacter turnerae]
MNDTDDRLLKIEQRLDSISIESINEKSAQDSEFIGEIDLIELWESLWSGKFWLLGITTLFILFGVLFSLSLPNMYESKGVYGISQDDGVAKNMPGQLGGLAAIAGINLGAGGQNKINHAVVLGQSWPFWDELIRTHNLKPLVFGVKEWDRARNKFIWDEDIYLVDEQKWIRKPPSGKEAEPSSYEVFDKIIDFVEIKFDAPTGLLSIKVKHYSPHVAQEWVEMIVEKLNGDFRDRDIVKAEKNIGYLQKKIDETKIAELKTVFYNMVEAQTKTLMLARVDEDYLVEPVIIPMVAESPVSPNRKLIVVLFAVAGGVFSLLFLFVKNIFSKRY